MPVCVRDAATYPAMKAGSAVLKISPLALLTPSKELLSTIANLVSGFCFAAASVALARAKPTVTMTPHLASIID